MKKLVALLLGIIMVFSMISFASADEEPLTITVMLPDFYSDKEWLEDGNPVLDAIEKAANVDLKITWVANSAYTEMTSYTLADSANMPMVMVLTGARDSIVIDSARAGAFWDLTDYISQFPNLAAGSQGVYDNISVDGRVYGIYRSRAYPRSGIYYRSDIAAKVGITEEPTTIEELTKLAEALAGYSEDTYALNMCKYVAGTINYITVAMGAPQTWGVNENGDIYPAHESPAFLKGLNWLRHLYEIGGIDPDFMTIESGNWDSIERTGKAFMRFDCLDNCYRQQEWFENNEGVTETIFAMVNGLKNDEGSITVWPQNAGFSGEIAITKSVKDEATMLRVLKFLDWCNSAEGQTLLNWGLDGETFFIHADGFRYTKPESGEDVSEYVYKIQHSLNQLGMNVNGDLTPKAATTALRDEYAALNIAMTPYAVSNPCYPLTSETDVMFGTTLSTKLEDAHVQYIAGIISEEELRAVWQEWSDEGGAQMTKEYNEAYHATK